MTFRLRILLATLPGLVGTLTWQGLEKFAGEDYPYGLHPLWIYLWHPPLMDLLFGILVLASFVEHRRRWWLYAATLGLVSFLVHTAAVLIVTNTQWLSVPFIELRFLSVVPVALGATVALTSVTAVLAGSALRRILVYSAIAGVCAGMLFLLALEVDTTGQSWFWRGNVQWMLWHVSIAAALHIGIERRPA